jgi:transcriptional regulator with XRE-family HTH domain
MKLVNSQGTTIFYGFLRSFLIVWLYYNGDFTKCQAFFVKSPKKFIFYFNANKIKEKTKMGTIENIIETIKKENKKNNILEKEIGLPSGAISHWVKGKYNPSTDAIIKIARYFDVSADYLLGLTDSSTPTQTPSEPSQIQTLFDMLNRDNQISALGYIEGMLSEQGYTHGELVRISPALDLKPTFFDTSTSIEHK